MSSNSSNSPRPSKLLGRMLAGLGRAQQSREQSKQRMAAHDRADKKTAVQVSRRFRLHEEGSP